MDVKEIRDCPDCGSTNIIQSTVRDQVICRECGLIFEPHVPLELEKPVAAPAKVKKAAKKVKAKPVKKPKKAKKVKAKPAKKPKKAKKVGALKRLLKGFKKKK